MREAGARQFEMLKSGGPAFNFGQQPRYGAVAVHRKRFQFERFAPERKRSLVVAAKMRHIRGSAQRGDPGRAAIGAFKKFPGLIKFSPASAGRGAKKKQVAVGGTTLQGLFQHCERLRDFVDLAEGVE